MASVSLQAETMQFYKHYEDIQIVDKDGNKPLEGKTIKKVVHSKDGTHLYILAHDANNSTTLLVYDHANKKVIETLGTTACVQKGGTFVEYKQGMTNTEAAKCSASCLQTIGDIALTEDGYLIGIGKTKTPCPTYVTLKELKIYKWSIQKNRATGEAEVWKTITNSANVTGGWFNATCGDMLAYHGSSASGTIYYSAVTTGDSQDMRYVYVSITDADKLTAVRNGGKDSAIPALTYDSPCFMGFADNSNVYLNWYNKEPKQIAYSTNPTTSNAVATTIVNNHIIGGKEAWHTPMFTYEGEQYVVAASGQAIHLSKKTQTTGNGLENFTPADITYTPLDAHSSATHQTTLAAATQVGNSDELAIFVLRDDDISKYSTVSTGTPDIQFGGAAIYAANLKMTPNEDFTEYTLEFTSNENALSGELVLYDAAATIKQREQGTATELGRINLSNLTRVEGGSLPKKGSNTYKITLADLTPFMRQATTKNFAWGVELNSKPITTMKKVANIPVVNTTAAIYNTVDKSLTSDYFGRIYAVYYGGRYNPNSSTTSQHTNNNGMRIYSHDYVLDETFIQGSGGAAYQLHKPNSTTIDNDGRVYIADAADEHPGVFTYQPSDGTTGEFTSFFAGDLAPLVHNGYVVNGSNEIAACFHGITISPDASDQRLIAQTEYPLRDDNEESSERWGLLYYRIRHDSGDTYFSSPVTQWTDLPSECGEMVPYLFRSKEDYNVSVDNCPVSIVSTNLSGFMYFVGHHCDTPSSTDVPVQIYNSKTNCIWSSHNDANFTSRIENLNGGAIALTNNFNRLITYNSSGEFIIHDITWGEEQETDKGKWRDPTFTYVGAYASGLTDAPKLYQMSVDYAGNLIVSGANGTFAIYSLPKDENTCLTPARETFTCKNIAIFTNESGDKQWSNTANWNPAILPTAEHRVLIKAPCEVNCTTAVAKSIDLHENATLTVLPTGALTVQETIRKVAGDVENMIYEDIERTPHEASALVVKADASGQGVLAQFDETGTTPATVQICGTYANGKGWNVIATPFAQNAQSNFYASWMMHYNESMHQWEYLNQSSTTQLFKGYLLTQPTANTVYTLQGNLPAATTQTIPLTYTTGDDNKGSNLVGNSWTAPLQISKFEEEDFKGVEPTIYVHDYQKPNGATDEVLGYYRSAPISDATKEFDVINPLQGFFVVAKDNATERTLTLNYANLVEKAAKQPSLNPYRAPQAQIEREEMKLRITGTDALYCDLRIVQQANFTHDFDNGYDARKLLDDAPIPYLAAASTAGDMAVLATPIIDGTFLNFERGDADTYTFTFQYDGAAEYQLEDKIANEVTDIRTGSTYTFMPSDDDSYRFRIVKAQRMPDTATDAPTIWATGKSLYMTNPLGVRTQVTIYSMDGKLIQQTTTTDAILPMQVPHRGVYIIQVRSELGTQTIKHIM